MSFTPAAPASTEPDLLEIRVGAASSEVRVAGRVVRASTGAPVADARLRFACMATSSAGSMNTASRSVHTDAQGRFEILLPRTPQRIVSVYPSGQHMAALVQTFDDLGRVEEPPLELAVP